MLGGRAPPEIDGACMPLPPTGTRLMGIVLPVRLIPRPCACVSIGAIRKACIDEAGDL